MIVIIDGVNADHYTGLLQRVFELRTRVFRDRLGWDVEVTDGQERDHFDNLFPTHIVSITDDGQVAGAMRLLQTTGPNMLADVFSTILKGEPAPRSPLIWEATRFCVDTNILHSGKTRNSISYITSEVMIGAFEYARAAGVEDAVAVIDPIMDRVLKRSCNAPYDYLGKATPMGKVTAMAALMDCSEARISAVRRFSGITGDVILDEELAIAQYGDTAITKQALQAYLREQLDAADSTDELHATLKLISEIEK